MWTTTHGLITTSRRQPATNGTRGCWTTFPGCFQRPRGGAQGRAKNHRPAEQPQPAVVRRMPRWMPNRNLRSMPMTSSARTVVPSANSMRGAVLSPFPRRGCRDSAEYSLFMPLQPTCWSAFNCVLSANYWSRNSTVRLHGYRNIQETASGTGGSLNEHQGSQNDVIPSPAL